MLTRGWAWWRIGLLWLVVLMLLNLIAYTKRHDWEQFKANYIAHQLNQYTNYDHLLVEFEYQVSLRPKAMYLILDREVESQELMHALLLCEPANYFGGHDWPRENPLKAIDDDWRLHTRLIQAADSTADDSSARMREATAFMQLRLGEYDAALANLDAVARQDSWTADWASKAYLDLLVLFGRENEAEQLLLRRWQISSKSPSYSTLDSLLEYAKWLLASERYLDVIQLLETQPSWLKHQAEYWQYLGAAKVRLGLFDAYKQQILAELASPVSPKRVGSTVCTVRFWQVRTDLQASKRIMNMPGLSQQQVITYSQDPHLAIIDGRYDIAKLYYQHIDHLQWTETYEVSPQPELLTALEQWYLAQCEVYRKHHGEITSPSSDPDICPSKDFTALLLLRCYCATENWEKAAQVDRQFSVGDNYLTGADRQRARLLYTIARGGRVDQLNLRRLGASGELSTLLLSYQFKAALAASGMERKEVLAQIRSVIKPWLPGAEKL